MLTKVRHVKPIGGYRIAVEFSDGSHGTHDFAGVVGATGPMVAPLRDETWFARVFLDLGGREGTARRQPGRRRRGPRLRTTG